jgi:hypothetical protein
VKPLAFWLAGLLVVFGAFALVNHLRRSANPDRLFVVVDSSFPMTDVWNEVPDALDGLDNARYSEYALATEKDLIHGWDTTLELGAVTPFAPCDFDDVQSYELVDEANEIILITTAGSCDTSFLTDWRVIKLEP